MENVNKFLSIKNTFLVIGLFIFNSTVFCFLNSFYINSFVLIPLITIQIFTLIRFNTFFKYFIVTCLPLIIGFFSNAITEEGTAIIQKKTDCWHSGIINTDIREKSESLFGSSYFILLEIDQPKFENFLSCFNDTYTNPMEFFSRKKSAMQYEFNGIQESVPKFKMNCIPFRRKYISYTNEICFNPNDSTYYFNYWESIQ